MISIKTPAEIAIMHEGGIILKKIIDDLVEFIFPGITTADINKKAEALVAEHNVRPAFLGYGGFPATVCTSVNEGVVHCVPSNRVLQQDDIISIDMGIVYKDLNLDSAITVPVLGDKSYKQWSSEHPREHELLETTRNSLYAGIEQALPGNRVGAISAEVQRVIDRAGFGIVRDLVGHGIGKRLHEEPQIPNIGKPTDGPILKEGMVIAIEPIVTMGDWHLAIAPDGKSYYTKDGSWAAHFEHTVAITANGPLILTK